MSQQSPIELEFSSKYDSDHARQYLHKHRDGLARRLSHWRDEQLARWALAAVGDPQVVLDLPCGAGRFWPLLAEQPGRQLLAADNSADMLAVARAAQPPEVVARVRTFQTSAFAIDLPIYHWACYGSDSPWRGQLEILPGNLAGELWFYSAAVARKPQNASLLQALNQFIASYRNSRDYRDLTQRWLGQTYNDPNWSFASGVHARCAGVEVV